MMAASRGAGREFQQGYLEANVPSEPFNSPWKLLFASARVFFANLGFLAAVTLMVFLPGKAALQIIFDSLDVRKGGLAAYLGMDLSDLVLGSLAAPAAIYGLMERFRTGKAAPIARSIRWGLRQWIKMLWTRFKVEITITLWGALFVIPGVVAMVRLIFTDPIVAIEGDRASAVLERSRELSRGYGWRIFGVVLPVMIVELIVPFLILDAIGGSEASRPVIAVVDSLLSVGGQWVTIIVLLMYLGVVPATQPAATKRSRV
jgi:hypothetical protein